MAVNTVAGMIQGKQPSASVTTPIQIQTLRLERTNSEERVILMSMSVKKDTIMWSWTILNSFHPAKVTYLIRL